MSVKDSGEITQPVESKYIEQVSDELRRVTRIIFRAYPFLGPSLSGMSVHDGLYAYDAGKIVEESQRSFDLAVLSGASGVSIQFLESFRDVYIGAMKYRPFVEHNSMPYVGIFRAIGQRICGSKSVPSFLLNFNLFYCPQASSQYHELSESDTEGLCDLAHRTEHTIRNEIGAGYYIDDADVGLRRNGQPYVIHPQIRAGDQDKVALSVQQIWQLMRTASVLCRWPGAYIPVGVFNVPHSRHPDSICDADSLFG